jgi:hypothetical protein
MINSGKGQWGGKRPGAGRPRNEAIREMMAGAHVSRTRVYLATMRIKRLTPEALEFFLDSSHGRFITGKALDIAGEFDTPEAQIAALKLAIERRKARKRMSLARAILNWRRLCDEADHDD